MMTQTSRKVLAMVVVTTALCVDQVARAAPAECESVGMAAFAGRVVRRLSVTFSQVVPTVIPPQARHAKPAALPPVARVRDQRVCQPGASLSPFRINLPPPLA